MKISAFCALLLLHSLPLFAEPQVRHGNGVFIMESDARITPNDHPLDLVGQTILARRIDAERYELSRGPLQYRDPGPLIGTPGPERGTVNRNLIFFQFPIGNAKYHHLFISGLGSIHFGAANPNPARPYAEAAAIAGQEPLVAPVLFPRSSGVTTAVYAREEGDLVVVTWKWSGFGNPQVRGDVQAVLHANGDIEFSYARCDRFLGGTAVITTGSESVRFGGRSVVRALDLPGDAVNADATTRDLADIHAVDVVLIPELELLDVRVEVGKPISSALVGNPDLAILVTAGTARFHVGFGRFGTFAFSNRGDLPQSPLSISGSTFHIRLPRAFLPDGPFHLGVVTNVQPFPFGSDSDFLEVRNMTIEPSSGTLRTDMSHATGPVSAPIVETFTVPALDAEAVWDVLEQQSGLRADQIEAVAIYTTFPTDIDLTSFPGATSVIGGNSGVDGIGGAHTSGAPRKPSLMYLNMASRSGPLLRLMARRWLFHAAMKQGTAVVPLSVGGFALSQLDTRAAFTSGSSPMGGFRFEKYLVNDLRATCGGVEGFSWLDLYLMGLARAEEVPLIELVTGSWSCNVSRFNPEKTIGTIDQVIDALGPRVPSYETSPKSFKVAYVLIEHPQARWPDGEQMVRTYAAEFSRQFAEVTGGRGSIVTALPPTRHRAARH